MAATALHISISAEKLFSIGGLNVNNSMLTSLIASGLLIAFALWVRVSLKKTNRPTGVQNLAEFIVESLTSLVYSVTNSKKKTEEFFPLVATFFLFILLNNWLGLLPGAGTIGFYEGESMAQVQFAPSAATAKVANTTVQAREVIAQTDAEHPATPAETTHESTAPTTEEHAAAAAHEEVPHESEHKVFVPYFRAGTADLNMTIALGLISIACVQFFGVKHLKLAYFKKFINFSSPIMFFVGLLEIVSEISRIISFAFRLFGNVFAGEVLLIVISALTYVVVPMPFYGMEIFVGFIQALVFAMLSVVFFNIATMGHDEH
jgi:F-type H+-transporting ATPase subunit a